MPTGIGRARRVTPHIAIPIQSIQHRIGGRKLANRRVVVARAVVIQPTRRIVPLPGIAVTSGERATAVAAAPIRRVEAAGGDGAAAIQRFERRALRIGDELFEKKVHTSPKSLT